jgi:hypothetical protein
MLSRGAATMMTEFIEKNPWYLGAFRYSHAADEMLFQTLVAHLGIDVERATPTFTKWPDSGAAHPLVITDAILQEATIGWHLMARKFGRIFR